MPAPRTNDKLRQRIIELKREHPDMRVVDIALRAKANTVGQVYYYLRQFESDTVKAEKEAQDEHASSADNGQDLT